MSFPVIFRGGARLWRTDVELKQSSEHLEQMESTVHRNQGDSQGSAPERDSAAQGEYRAAVMQARTNSLRTENHQKDEREVPRITHILTNW